MVEPEMVMLDEPMAGVNPALTQSLLGHVKDLRERGHDRAVRRARHGHGPRHQRLGHRHGPGPVIAEGPPDAVMADPAVIDAYLGAHHDAPLIEAEEAAARRGRGAPLEAERRRGGRRPSTSRAASDARASRRSVDRRAHETAPRTRCCAPTSSSPATCPGVNILNGCDLYVGEGELVGIIGPNGAGKSTLLKALFGLVTVRSGTVTLRGEDITGLKANQLVRPGRRLRPADQQRVPARSPSRRTCEMGCYQQPKTVHASGSTSSPACSRRSATGASSAPARCPAASGRWWRWAAR